MRNSRWLLSAFVEGKPFLSAAFIIILSWDESKINSHNYFLLLSLFAGGGRYIPPGQNIVRIGWEERKRIGNSNKKSVVY